MRGPVGDLRTRVRFATVRDGRVPTYFAAGATCREDCVANILIAEDERPIRSLLARVLGEAGYTVVVAESATEAKSKSDAFEGAIDLLITNHMLRDGLGREVADYITQKRPGMRVLQISGHPYEQLKAEGHLMPGAAFLAKPFGRHELDKKVAEVLRVSQQRGAKGES